jgi:iron complex outermembrane receptor protein
VFKPDPDKRDQIRMSLTRSYKTPSMYNLIGLYQQSTGENSPTNPDRSGNPSLRPELATGVDITFERYLAQGGVLSATVFRRNVQDLIRYQLNDSCGLQQQVCVVRPENIGNAITQGLELEAKFRLNQWWPQALPVDIRSNVSFFNSRVDGVPGPDNRLDRQPDMTANLGADYRMRSWPLTVGGNLNLNPAYSTRVSAEQVAWIGSKRVLDVYGLWRINERTGLRLTLSNALGRDYVSSSRFDNGTVTEAATTTAPSWRSLQLRLEMKL